MNGWTHPRGVRITEVGPRDGLQNEARPIATDDKVRFVDALSAAGCAEIEVSSFVSPKWVPQLADAEQVFARISRRPGCVYSALVPNLEGLERALAARVDKIAVFTAASETFSRRNTNASIAESLDRIRPVVDGARAARRPIRAYVSCVVRCPYEGPVDGRAVRRVVDSLRGMAVDEIDLGDTIGAAVPDDVDRLCDSLDGALAPSDFVLHLHDTRRTALACALRALQLGVTRFDSSAGGLGGCPFAPGARGNLATEDLCYMLSGCGIETGVDASAIGAAAASVKRTLGDSASR
ncbi:MAG: hydroxymethylglutaryl-CoA lyase [Phycisphaerae bacterium]|nr:hydroxymethylglutaryl-CoA lyase [Phycisphaerae bacterium]